MRIVEAVLPFPNFNPVLIHLWGPIGIRWYALAYITGLLLGWWAILRMLREKRLWTSAPFSGRPPASEEEIGDLVVWTTLGVVLGGRLGWILFYGTFYCGLWGAGQDWCSGLPLGFLTNPLRLLEIWKGGMSFHGGMIGVTIALWLFCRRRKLDLLRVADITAVVTPIGLFFGRIANFVNGELPGKISDVPWAVQFCSPHMRELYGSECPWGALPRHPSQLYEAFLEGIVLFAVLQICLRLFRLHERPGLMTAIFVTGYGAARFFVEFFRDSESKFVGWFSMGMALSIPMWAVAAFLFWVALARRRPAAA
jgi:phosphatidylglycerol---prolipoprotein diacylglyceryl transferase